MLKHKLDYLLILCNFADLNSKFGTNVINRKPYSGWLCRNRLHLDRVVMDVGRKPFVIVPDSQPQIVTGIYLNRGAVFVGNFEINYEKSPAFNRCGFLAFDYYFIPKLGILN